MVIDADIAAENGGSNGCGCGESGDGESVKPAGGGGSGGGGTRGGFSWARIASSPVPGGDSQQKECEETAAPTQQEQKLVETTAAADGTNSQARRCKAAGRASGVCSLHGKRRGGRFLRESPTSPGQLVCLPGAQCKCEGRDHAKMTARVAGVEMVSAGAAVEEAKTAAAPGQPAPTGVCSLHGKRRGARYLRESPTEPGQLVCLEDAQCKVESLANRGAGLRSARGKRDRGRFNKSNESKRASGDLTTDEL